MSLNTFWFCIPCSAKHRSAATSKLHHGRLRASIAALGFTLVLSIVI
jgi:hypothetical protein